MRERLVHGIVPDERPPTPVLLTGSELREWRVARGWTQAQTAQALGVSERTIRGAETAPDAPLGRSIRAGLNRQKSGKIPADPVGLPGPGGDRQKPGRPRG